MGHENAEGMAHVGVRVEPPVRLGRVGTVVGATLNHKPEQVRPFGFDALSLGFEAPQLRTAGLPRADFD